MLEQAKMSYIVDGDRGLYDEMLRVGSFVDETRELKKLVQGVGDEGMQPVRVYDAELCCINRSSRFTGRTSWSYVC